jgi:16S rRNA (guanine966-N2)-methyltransferase
VRIIAGRQRGSKLAVPDRPGLRPTPDRVRVTLFDWLAFVLPGKRALDLFAGSGALGIEAWSRGAAAVTLVEADPELAAALRGNVERLHADGVAVTASTAERFLAGAPAVPYDVVFIDPPFAAGLWSATLARLADGGWLADGALVYVESPPGAEVAIPSGWTLHREGKAGEVRYALWRVSGDSGRSHAPGTIA